MDKFCNTELTSRPECQRCEKPTGKCNTAGELGPVRSVMDAGLLQGQLRPVLPILHRHFSTGHLVLLYRTGERPVLATACMMCVHTTL